MTKAEILPHERISSRKKPTASQKVKSMINLLSTELDPTDIVNKSERKSELHALAGEVLDSPLWQRWNAKNTIKKYRKKDTHLKVVTNLKLIFLDESVNEKRFKRTNALMK